MDKRNETATHVYVATHKLTTNLGSLKLRIESMYLCYKCFRHSLIGRIFETKAIEITKYMKALASVEQYANCILYRVLYFSMYEKYKTFSFPTQCPRTILCAYSHIHVHVHGQDCHRVIQDTHFSPTQMNIPRLELKSIKFGIIFKEIIVHLPYFRLQYSEKFSQGFT